MPDLSAEASHQFWFEYPDPSIYRVISFMESVEDWTLDGDPSLEEAIKKLGEALEDIGRVELKQEPQFVELITYIKASRMLRIMQCLDTAYPGAASKLLAHAETTTASTDDVPGLFLRRNFVFERLRLLSRIFSKEKISLVLKILEEADNG
jgi:intracellular multiplication protein IcmW